jgi:hypothetical protein
MSTTSQRYFFSIITPSETIYDWEGTELSSPEAARAHAIEDARALMSMAVLEGRDISGRSVSITNEDDEVLFVVAFRKAISPEDER